MDFASGSRCVLEPGTTSFHFRVVISHAPIAQLNAAATQQFCRFAKARRTEGHSDDVYERRRIWTSPNSGDPSRPTCRCIRTSGQKMEWSDSCCAHERSEGVCGPAKFCARNQRLSVVGAVEWSLLHRPGVSHCDCWPTPQRCLRAHLTGVCPCTDATSALGMG